MDFLKFRMIDRVITLNKTQRSILCKTQLPESSFIFDAHFPGFPILPGVFMIETIAQAAGLLFIGLEGFKKMPILFGVEHTRFRHLVPPATALTVSVQLVHSGSGYIVCEGDISNQGSRVANAEVRLKLIDTPIETEALQRQACIAVQLPL